MNCRYFTLQKLTKKFTKKINTNRARRALSAELDARPGFSWNKIQMSAKTNAHSFRRRRCGRLPDHFGRLLSGSRVRAPRSVVANAIDCRRVGGGPVASAGRRRRRRHWVRRHMALTADVLSPNNPIVRSTYHLHAAHLLLP